MATYRVNVRNTKTAIPFPQNAKRGDQAEVYFPSKGNYQLVQYYTFNGRKWEFTGFDNIDLQSNN